MTLPGAERVTQETLKNHFDPAVYRERGELPPFFAGLLPEGPLRRRLAATRKSDRDMDDFGILAAAGEDLSGAVTVVPANLDNLTAAARAHGVTGGADNLEISVPEQAAEGAASLSGVQDKLALSHAKDGIRYCMPVKGMAGFRGFGTNVAIDKMQRQETLGSYTAIAKQAGISERITKAAVTQTISRAKDLWPKALQDMDVPEAVRLEIADRLNTLPLAGGAKP